MRTLEAGHHPRGISGVHHSEATPGVETNYVASRYKGSAQQRFNTQVRVVGENENRSAKERAAALRFFFQEECLFEDADQERGSKHEHEQGEG